MNGLYVTVSIPLLLVLAGFNHAHGLTTFGKTNNQQSSPTTTVEHGKQCASQASCLIRGTTCLKGYCYCGDNTHPINGECNADFKGPGHLCEKDEECVSGAECTTPKQKSKPNNMPSSHPETKVCQCAEGLFEDGATCSGGTKLGITSGTILIAVAVLSKMWY